MRQDTSGERRAYGAGTAVAAMTSLLTVWTTIVRDDGSGMSFFMLIMAAIVGSHAARFRAAGTARAMAGVALMQAALGVAIATAPVTAQVAGAPERALLFCGVFAALWLVAAALFRHAARGEA